MDEDIKDRFEVVMDDISRLRADNKREVEKCYKKIEKLKVHLDATNRALDDIVRKFVKR